MAGPTAVTHTELYPTHDITLSDGTDSVGFIFCDGKGNPMPNFDRVGMPSDALLASQGESEYSTYEPGYMRIEQTDWSGGRGLNDFDKDKTRYFDGTNIYPMSDGVILGPQEHFADNLNVKNKYLPDDIGSETITYYTCFDYLSVYKKYIAAFCAIVSSTGLDASAIGDAADVARVFPLMS